MSRYELSEAVDDDYNNLINILKYKNFGIQCLDCSIDDVYSIKVTFMCKPQQ